MTVKELKKKLHCLKKNSPEKGQEIQNVSKLIRRKLKHGMVTNDIENRDSNNSISSQLRKHFWKTCKKLFDPVERVLPSFSVESCVCYFANILSQRFKHKIFHSQTGLNSCQLQLIHSILHHQHTKKYRAQYSRLNQELAAALWIRSAV